MTDIDDDRVDRIKWAEPRGKGLGDRPRWNVGLWVRLRLGLWLTLREALGKCGVMLSRLWCGIARILGEKAEGKSGK